MDHIDSKFIGLLSSRLQKFKRVKSNLYNFRCPICGDSKKNKSKTRGYLYAVKANTNFKCHNCGASMSLNNFIKEIDSTLHKQYTMEKFKSGHTGRNFVSEEPVFKFEAPKFKSKIKLPKASEHPRPAGYLTARKLNPEDFYYAKHFKKFANSLKPTFENEDHDEERIIIPLYYKKNLIGFQGRSIKPNPVKYITVMLDDDAPKIYGLDKIRTDAPVYVTEGPFDSTFISNAIAMCGADANVSSWGISNPVWIYDNEPRNREITDRISKTIDSGDSVVIWPDSIDDKDINDMVMSGLDVESVIKSNTYSGLEAKLKFNTWKKI
jgi:transcription elongation factor Elf1|tara:strand:+ start:139 stop:1107 length:969 start_codon:yes stop_codon:yes gene_type:complete